MILIKKRQEPRVLREYRKTIGASYQNMHGAPSGRKDEDGKNEDVYSIVLNHLIDEQGGLCAYCMKRIPDYRKKPAASIEHIDPQSKTSTEKALDYSNMLAVCNGNRNAKTDDEITCDARRGNRHLDINPLDGSTLIGIQYRNSGKIYSDDSEIDRQLNEVLNLNCEAMSLIKCRKSALNKMLSIIERRHKGDREFYQRLLAEYEASRTEKPPFVGILIWWLKKHI